MCSSGAFHFHSLWVKFVRINIHTHVCTYIHLVKVVWIYMYSWLRSIFLMHCTVCEMFSWISINILLYICRFNFQFHFLSFFLSHFIICGLNSKYSKVNLNLLVFLVNWLCFQSAHVQFTIPSAFFLFCFDAYAWECMFVNIDNACMCVCV